jgi:hypothetical protein
MLAGTLIAAVGLALPWILPQHVYHQRWIFVAFTAFAGGWYTLIFGWWQLDAIKKAKR